MIRPNELQNHINGNGYESVVFVTTVPAVC